MADSGAATRVSRSDDKQRITLTRRKQNKWRSLRSRSKTIRRRIETSRWCFVSFSDGLVWRRIIAAMVAMVYSSKSKLPRAYLLIPFGYSDRLEVIRHTYYTVPRPCL